jgi:hypothetical protein
VNVLYCMISSKFGELCDVFLWVLSLQCSILLSKDFWRHVFPFQIEGVGQRCLATACLIIYVFSLTP